MENLVGAIIAGVIAGLFPLVFGLVRDQRGLAIGGFVACLAGGIILGLLLALPLAILFLVVIYMQSRDAQTRPSTHAGT